MNVPVPAPVPPPGDARDGRTAHRRPARLPACAAPLGPQARTLHGGCTSSRGSKNRASSPPRSTRASSTTRSARASGWRTRSSRRGTLEEAELLKLLAARYKTRFVSTERLSKADIDRKTLERIPHKLAERLQVFPVVFDARASSLSFVAAAPGEDDVEKQVLVMSGVREARALVARPAAIRAAIAKFYLKNPRAFADLAERETPAPSQLDVFDPSPFGDGFEDPSPGS
ncbi:MAG: hypothetical protein M5U28_27750 [Sandaracinaceae bacterium]|nr:hypothetical protein [Sandaracinaceae bacterium]